jgi:DNA-binding XRE family transcriptional regulator
MSPQDDISVSTTVKLRNAKMLEARKRFGYSQVSLAQMAGVSVALICRLEKFDLKTSLLNYWTESKLFAVAECLDLSIDDIAPPSMIGKSLYHTVVSVQDVPVDRLLAMASAKQRFILPSPADIAEARDENALVKKLIGKLPLKRSQRIVTARMGLGPGGVHSLIDLAKEFNITRTRVSQIEVRARKDLVKLTEAHENDRDLMEEAARVASKTLKAWEEQQC